MIGNILTYEEEGEPGATAQRPRLSRPVRAHVSRQPGSWLTWDVGQKKDEILHAYRPPFAALAFFAV